MKQQILQTALDRLRRTREEHNTALVEWNKIIRDEDGYRFTNLEYYKAERNRVHELVVETGRAHVKAQKEIFDDDIYEIWKPAPDTGRGNRSPVRRPNPGYIN